MSSTPAHRALCCPFSSSPIAASSSGAWRPLKRPTQRARPHAISRRNGARCTSQRHVRPIASSQSRGSSGSWPNANASTSASFPSWPRRSRTRRMTRCGRLRSRRWRSSTGCSVSSSRRWCTNSASRGASGGSAPAQSGRRSSGANCRARCSRLHSSLGHPKDSRPDVPPDTTRGSFFSRRTRASTPASDWLQRPGFSCRLARRRQSGQRGTRRRTCGHHEGSELQREAIWRSSRAELTAPPAKNTTSACSCCDRSTTALVEPSTGTPCAVRGRRLPPGTRAPRTS